MVLKSTLSQRASAAIERGPGEYEDSGSWIFYRCICSCCIRQGGRRQNTYSQEALFVDAGNSLIAEVPIHFEKSLGLSQPISQDSKLVEHSKMLGT